MTEYKLQCRYAEGDSLTARRAAPDSDAAVRVYAYADNEQTTTYYANPSNARDFARGILALVDEIDGGETKPAPAADVPASLWGIKVGDEVRILKDEAEYATVEVGDVFTVMAADGHRIVVDDGDDGCWYFYNSDSVEKVVAPIGVTDLPEYVTERVAILRKAREIVATDPEDDVYDVVDLARFLAGN